MIKLGSADKSSSGCRTFPGRRATARRCVEPKRATIWASISSQLNKLRFTFSTVFNTVGATIRAGADRRATATPTKFIKTLKWPPMAASCTLSLRDSCPPAALRISSQDLVGSCSDLRLPWGASGLVWPGIWLPNPVRITSRQPGRMLV